MKGVGTWRWVGDSLYFSRAHRPQPTPRSEAERFNREAFQVSTQIVKIMDAYQRDFAQQLSARTQLAAQDFMYIALWGRIGHMVRRDGTKVFSMAARQDVSNLLDALWQSKNGLLVRRETWWEGLEPGSVGQVVGVRPDGAVGYIDGGGGQASEPFFKVPPINPSFNSANFVGTNFAAIAIRPTQQVVLTGVRLWINNAGTGHTIYAGLYQANPANASLNGGSLVAQGTATAVTTGLMSLPFNSPATLTADTWYYVGPVILGAGNVLLAKRGNPPSSSVFAQTTGTLPATAPAVGDGTQSYVGWWCY